eukprot:TRINITY_DN15748_c0_g1_i1.p1 TRINITY_DN15748_c0_g1~~TRINITY_DN15748_c0_g1_i1.p1  ORF type:complete len:386 (-),score=16.52 TRINITY_DN15748_c0_g1_i1:66-1223(-)
MQAVQRSTQRSSPQIFHWACDQCSSKNSQYRFKCTVCPDFDFCNQCYLKISHPHHLELYNVTEIKPDQLQWSCDSCKKRTPNSRFSCSGECHFNLCNECYLAQGAAHPHLLQNLHDLTRWACDGCRRNFRPEDNSYRFRCPNSGCDFDLCLECNQNNRRPHPHQLKLLKGFQSWICDLCKDHNPRIRLRCFSCQDYDLCVKCYMQTSHSHPLYLINDDHNYVCDGCGGKAISNRWRCTVCRDFDLCSSCFSTRQHEHPMKNLIIDKPLSCTGVTSSRNTPNNPIAPAPAPYVPQPSQKPVHQSTQTPPLIRETPLEIIKTVRSLDEDDDDKLCVVCLDGPKNAVFVHGDEGHQVCCLRCARDIKAKNSVCPMCRLPIDAVVRVYN